jgi:hypothetical protein
VSLFPLFLRRAGKSVRRAQAEIQEVANHGWNPAPTITHTPQHRLRPANPLTPDPRH